MYRHQMEPADPSRSFILGRGRWVAAGGKLRARRRPRAMQHRGSLPARPWTAQGLWRSAHDSQASADIGDQGPPLAPSGSFRMPPGTTCDTVRGDVDLDARALRGHDDTDHARGWLEDVRDPSWAGKTRGEARSSVSRAGKVTASPRAGTFTRVRDDASVHWRNRMNPADSSGISSPDSWRWATRFR